MSEQERKDADWCLELAAMVLRGDVPNESVTIKELADDLDRFRALLRRAPSPHGEDVGALVEERNVWRSRAEQAEEEGRRLRTDLERVESAAALRSRPVEPEPVAWRWRYPLQGTWHLSHTPPLQGPGRAVPEELYALYASPVAPREPEK